MIRGIHHIALSTKNLEKLLFFYRDILGFEEVLSSNWNIGTKDMDTLTNLNNSSAQFAFLKANNAYIEIFQFATPIPKSLDPDRPVCDHGITHLCLAVIDIEFEYDRLKSAGMIFNCEPQWTNKGNRVCYGRDPDGNVIELFEVKNIESPISMSYK
jgi:glyoxylase I family protein